MAGVESLESSDESAATQLPIATFVISPLHSVPMELDPIQPAVGLSDNYTNVTSREPFVVIEDIPTYVDVISDYRVRTVLIVIHVIVSLVAITGNGMVLLVIYKKRCLRKSPTVLFILNLALCDLISCLLYRPLMLVELFVPFADSYFTNPFHLQQCQASVFLQSVFSGTGFLTIVAISQERLLLIVFPLQAKKFCSAGKTKKVLIVIWLIAIATSLPLPIKYCQIITLNLEGTPISLCGYFDGEAGAVVYFWFTFLLYFVFPLIILSVSYSKIFHALYRRSESLDVNQDAGGGKSMKVRRSLAKMMVCVAIIFAVCWGPDFLYFLYLSCGGVVSSNGFFWAIFVELLPIISSGLNPFIYTLNSRTFRLAFKSLLVRRTDHGEHSIGRSFYGPGAFQAQSGLYCNSPSLSQRSFTTDSPTLRRQGDICAYCLKQGFKSPNVRKSFPISNKLALSEKRKANPRDKFKRQWSCPEQLTKMRLIKQGEMCTCLNGKINALILKRLSEKSLYSDRSDSLQVRSDSPRAMNKRSWSPMCPSPLLEVEEGFFIGNKKRENLPLSQQDSSSSASSSDKDEIHLTVSDKKDSLIGRRLKGDVLL